LETINEEHEIRGSMNEERISRDTSNIKYPNLSQEKGRGNNEKNVGDKKGKAAEKMGTREPRKQISMNLNIGGTQAVNNIQNNQGRKKGELTKGGNQGNNEVRQKGLLMIIMKSLVMFHQIIIMNLMQLIIHMWETITLHVLLMLPNRARLVTLF
jgi:hypothetical protein